MDILEIKNVTYNYSNSGELVLSKVNQKFEIGKFYAIIGKSGAGKSTLLSLLAGLDKPQKGQILFNGNDIEKDGYSNHRKNNISLVFQNYNLIDYLTPIENVRLVNKNASETILFELGLDKSQINRNVMKLSGGQQQRVATIAKQIAKQGESSQLGGGAEVDGFNKTLTSLEINISPKLMIYVILFMSIVLMISLLISSSRNLRKSPKELLIDTK